MSSMFMKQRIPFFMTPSNYDKWDLSKNAMAVYVNLFKMADNEEGTCEPGKKTLARNCKIGLDSTYRAVRELKQRGLLTEEQRFLFDPETNKSRQTTNIYTVFLYPGQAFETDEINEKKEASTPIRQEVAPLSEYKGTPPLNSPLPPLRRGGYELDSFELDSFELEGGATPPIGGQAAAPPSEKEKQVRGQAAVPPSDPPSEKEKQVRGQAAAPPSDPPSEKEKYGQAFKCVFLYRWEYEGLVILHGEGLVNYCINRLDNYIYQEKKQYPCHYSVLMTWCAQDKEKYEKQKASNNGQAKPQIKPNRFVNYKQRDIDYSQYEKMEREFINKKLGEDINEND